MGVACRPWATAYCDGERNVPMVYSCCDDHVVMSAYTHIG